MKKGGLAGTEKRLKVLSYFLPEDYHSGSVALAA